MKKPTLAELIKSAEESVKPDDWYRQGLILNMFHGMSKTTLVEYCKEMEGIDEFKDGILRPGHSTTFIHVHTFIWFLRWKDENKYRTKKVTPTEILKEATA
ncbi:hypothetical protein [Enterococcus avium]|uniref:hypothetical protein n=1 Tax=Enterococcus avium TaxID=33945 RepID=UPI0028A13AC4|nr:hypothetical protein [Enterococcus avium]